MALKSRPPGQSATGVDTGELPPDLTRAVLSGVRWKATARIVAEVTRIAVVLVLARHLTPADYGVAGMALVVTFFGLMLTDPALGAALVQRPTIDERDRSTVFWMAAGLGALLTIVGIALSGIVADFFGEGQVKDLFVVTSLCFVVISLSVVHRALLTRQMAYRSLEIREMISVVSGGAVAIGVALAGFGPWAIVSNFVVYSLMSTILVWLLVAWRPQAAFSVESARNLSGFSVRIFSATMLSWGDQNLDNALVGRFVGAPALGAYSVAYMAMLLPVSMLGRPLHQALSPAFSRIQGDKDRLERAWLRSKRLSVAVVSPGLLALIVVAPDFVHVLFGEQWDDAIVPLQLLCVGGIADSVATLNWSVLQARGEAATLLRLTLVSAGVTWGAFIGGLHWGIVGVAASYAVAKWLLVVPTTWMTTRGVSFDFGATLRAGTEMLPAAIGSAGVGLAVRQLLLDTEIPEFLRLAVVGTIILVVYVALVLVVAPSVVRDVSQVVRRRADDSSLPSQPA